MPAKMENDVRAEVRADVRTEGALSDSKNATRRS